jgi:hypothetical protein
VGSGFSYFIKRGSDQSGICVTDQPSVALVALPVVPNKQGTCRKFRLYKYSYEKLIKCVTDNLCINITYN